MDLIQQLNWRYAAKKMTGAKVPQEKVERILEAIRLSVSSAGLQPYKIVVIENPELKGRIHELAAPQAQIVEASHLLVCAPWTEVTGADVDNYMQQIADIRHVPLESLAPFANSIKGFTTRSQELNAAWAARQAYIALGFGTVAAAMEEVDACPMEGFNTEKLDEILGLKEKGLKSYAILALGYRDTEKDFLAKAPKVRRSKEDLFIRL
jgi:nitroreductase/dihydropteridine reductase